MSVVGQACLNVNLWPQLLRVSSECAEATSSVGAPSHEVSCRLVLGVASTQPSGHPSTEARASPALLSVWLRPKPGVLGCPTWPLPV